MKSYNTCDICSIRRADHVDTNEKQQGKPLIRTCDRCHAKIMRKALIRILGGKILEVENKREKK